MRKSMRQMPGFYGCVSVTAIQIRLLLQMTFTLHVCCYRDTSFITPRWLIWLMFRQAYTRQQDSGFVLDEFSESACLQGGLSFPYCKRVSVAPFLLFLCSCLKLIIRHVWFFCQWPCTVSSTTTELLLWPTSGQTWQSSNVWYPLTK